jgi:CPA2 family monovalent cation:H+ antiporter-2
MNHLPPLIKDLGLILILAGITTLLFKKLKQPVVLGYILAGLLVSNHFPFFPDITDSANIRIWAEIGVIFLLFNLGLEFSFKKLMHVGGSASVTALIEVSLMLLIGFSVGKMLDWSTMDSIFLGGILSIASTTIIIRAFDELKVKTKRFATLVFGILIMEDLVAVLLMVLLSTIAVSRQFAGAEMLVSVLKLAFFLMLWFVSGIFFIPTLLRKASTLLNSETLLIVAIGLCLVMVILASEAGFSPALGAFIMGSILAETVQAERIEHIVAPVKDLFGAVFFISVGMLIDPKILLDYAGPIVLITVVFMVFKVFNVTLGALVSGQPLKISLQAGMSMGQIGEFSFIIATLGLTLGVISQFLYPIAVAISAITTFATPYMIKAASPLYNNIESKLPLKWQKALTRYSTGTQTMSSASDWAIVIRAFFVHVIIFSIIILGIIILFAAYVNPWMEQRVDNSFVSNLLTATVCLIVLTPFLWALVIRKLAPQAFVNLWSDRRKRSPLIFLRMVRALLAIIYISIFLLNFFSIQIAVAGLILLVSASVMFSRRIHGFYMRLENRFMSNFNDRERQQAIINRSELAPWDAHISQFIIQVGSPCTGMSLEEMGVREKIGVNIAMIKRGEHYTISAPSRFERIYPGDKVYVIGTDEQLEQFRKYIEPIMGGLAVPQQTHEVVLKKIKVEHGSPLFGKTIRESGIREKTNGLIVGIERDRKRILNPESNVIMQDGDRIWIVGDENLIGKLIVNLK